MSLMRKKAWILPVPSSIFMKATLPISRMRRIRPVTVKAPSGPCHSSKCCKISAIVVFFLLQQNVRVNCNIVFKDRTVIVSILVEHKKTGLRFRVVRAAGRSIAATTWGLRDRDNSILLHSAGRRDYNQFTYFMAQQRFPHRRFVRYTSGTWICLVCSNKLIMVLPTITILEIYDRTKGDKVCTYLTNQFCLGQ